jgi:hypothetical protein
MIEVILHDRGIAADHAAGARCEPLGPAGPPQQGQVSRVGLDGRAEIRGDPPVLRCRLDGEDLDRRPVNPSRILSPTLTGDVLSIGVSFSSVLLFRLRWTRIKPCAVDSIRAWTPETFGKTIGSTATSHSAPRPRRMASPATSRVLAGPPV